MRRLYSPSDAESGFSIVEMLLLVAVMLIFLGGVVVLMDRGVRTFETAGGGTEIREEGTHLLDRIEALVKDAKSFSVESQGSRPTDSTNYLSFAADLDGSGGSGAFEGSGRPITEMEGVRIAPAGAWGRNLLARVSGFSDAPETVLFSRFLSPRDPRAFEVGYLGEDDQPLEVVESNTKDRKITGVRVSIKLTVEKESRSFRRVIHLKNPAMLSAAGNVDQ